MIDGQQRLTTLQILLCAFRDFARKKEWKSLDRSASRLIENPDIDVMENPDEEQYKLWPTALNREIYSNIISAGGKEVIEGKYPVVRLPRKRKPEPRSVLVEAYVYFYGRIEEWVEHRANEGRTSENCATKLLQAIQRDFCVVQIALIEGDDSQEIFYSLNSQGRPLSQSDLLRSLIFMRAEKEGADRDSIFSDYWWRFETEFWSADIKRGGRTYSRLDIALRYFLISKTGALVDARRVNEEYRRWITSDPQPYSSVRDELADFARHCEIFEKFEFVEPNMASSDIRRVIKDLDVSTAVPLLMFLELDAGLAQSGYRQCVNLIESFLVRRALCGEETKEYNKLFVEIVASLRTVEPDKVLESLTNKLLMGGGTTRVWPGDDVVIENAITAPLFHRLRTPALRLVLERIELFERGKKSESHAIPDGLQIEHVMPQQWGTHWALEGATIPPNVVNFPFLADESLSHLADGIRGRNERVQTLGNLTLLNKYLNPAASHGAFDQKKAEYVHSVLRLNRYFDEIKDWDEEAIVRRGERLGREACKIWPRPDKQGG